jgi:threonine dehydrogenase-like Zn-dependent dehydrogenase
LRAVTVTEAHRLAPNDIADPQHGPNDVLARVSACGICGSDLHLMEAKLLPPGAVMGHEAAGVVEAVGANVSGFAPGDHVAIQPFDPCRSCDPCLAGATQRCVDNALTTIGLGFRQGAFAELIAVSPQMLVKLGTDVPLDLASLAEPLAVAYHGFERSRFASGMTVGVIGCGPIGLSAVALAKTLGAGRIWAADPNPFRQELAARLGADEAGKSPKDADLVFECAGARGTVDLAVGSVHGGGQVILLAVNIKGDSVYPFTWVTREAEIVGCLGYTIGEYAASAAMIADGRIDVAPMVTRRVSFDETDEAFFALLDGAPEGKVLVTP